MPTSDHSQGGDLSLGLPQEPGSTSELLDSTHVFTVEIIGIQASGWTPTPEGLEVRSLDMTFRLLDIFKGDPNLESKKTFKKTVQQRRESEFSESDYYGLWSHIDPEIGDGYLVVSKADLSTPVSPAYLLGEDQCLRLMEDGYISDVRLALEAEHRWRATIEKERDSDPQLAAANTLLDFADQQRAVLRDLFARYLWARLRLVFLEMEERPLQKVLNLLLSAETTADFRQSLLTDLYEGTLFLEGDTTVARPVINALLLLLHEEKAAALHQRIVDVYLYNLIFAQEGTRYSVGTIFPDQQERIEAERALSGFMGPHAREIAGWLSGGDS